MGAKINAMKTTTFLIGLYLAMSMPAHADLAYKLNRLVGYSVVHSGTITGYQDQGKNLMIPLKDVNMEESIH